MDDEEYGAFILVGTSDSIEKARLLISFQLDYFYDLEKIEVILFQLFFFFLNCGSIKLENRSKKKTNPNLDFRTLFNYFCDYHLKHGLKSLGYHQEWNYFIMNCFFF